MEKRKVYNGYNEMYMTGKELTEFLADVYVTFGRHHEKISCKKIDFKYYNKIIDNEKYRIFYNNLFIQIMNAETDEKIYFIGYTKNKPSWAKD